MPESPAALSFVDSENYKIQVYLIVIQLRPWTRWMGYKIWGINRAKHPSSCLNKFWVLENFNRKVNRVFAKRITLQKFYGIKKSAAKYHYSAKSGFLKNFRNYKRNVLVICEPVSVSGKNFPAFDTKNFENNKPANVVSTKKFRLNWLFCVLILIILWIFLCFQSSF